MTFDEQLQRALDTFTDRLRDEVAEQLRGEVARQARIVGDELAAGEVGLRDLPAGTQKLVAIEDLAREIERSHGAHRHGAAPD